MKTIKLHVTDINTYGQDEYIIADFELDYESVELIANAMLDDLDESERDDALEIAFDWFLENYSIEDEKINIVPFYNRTIRRKDFKVDYHANFVANYNDTQFLAVIDKTQTEMYDNDEVKHLLNTSIDQVQEPCAMSVNGEELYMINVDTYVDKDYNEYDEDEIEEIF